MKRMALVVAFAAIVGTTVVASSLGASAGAGREMQVTPDPGLPDDEFTLSNKDGSECEGEGSFVEMEVHFRNELVTERPRINPDDNGDWSVSFEIPDAELGIYEVEAECLGNPDATPPAPFGYEEIDFEIIAEQGGEFTFSATPTSGLAGSAVAITATDCQPGTGDAVVVTFTEPEDDPQFDPATDEADGVFPVEGEDASASGTIEVPDVAPGDYQINGFCVGEGGQPLTEARVVPFEVLAEAAPPTPVPDNPDFTG